LHSIPLYMDHFYGHSLKEHKNDNGRTQNQMVRKNFPRLDNDLSILDESVSKMNALLDIL